MNLLKSRARRALVAALVASVLLAAGAPVPVRAALPAEKRILLTRFLNALQAKKFDVAYALLSKPERTYFGSANNYASSYAADRIKIDSYQIVGSKVVSGDTIAVVSEKLEFFSHKAQRPGSLVAKIRYGIVSTGGVLGIKDPYHPWFAFDPENWSATANGVTATVRKVSFFTGQAEFVITFENRSDTTVTALPYGRTVIRDDSGKVHQPIETNIPALTDRELYAGVRIAPGAEYTGTMTFLTANRFTPASLSATISPFLADGADAPFALELPTFTLPK